MTATRLFQPRSNPSVCCVFDVHNEFCPSFMTVNLIDAFLYLLFLFYSEVPFLIAEHVLSTTDDSQKSFVVVWRITSSYHTHTANLPHEKVTHWGTHEKVTLWGTSVKDWFPFCALVCCLLYKIQSRVAVKTMSRNKKRYAQYSGGAHGIAFFSVKMLPHLQ